MEAKPKLDSIKPAIKESVEESHIDVSLFEDFDSKLLNRVNINNLDAFYIDNVLTENECKSLIKQTEQLGSKGYSFWHKDTSKKSFRNALTVEVHHTLLSDIIWNRIKDLVPLSIEIEDETSERFLDDLKGSWESNSSNKRILFAKYDVNGHVSLFNCVNFCLVCSSYRWL